MPIQGSQQGSQFESDFLIRFGDGAEAVAEEISERESVDETAENPETDAADHEAIGNDQAQGESDGESTRSIIGGADGIFGALFGGESADENAAGSDETDFETGTEWSPEVRDPPEADPDSEALLDAYFAEATAEGEAQEFLPILGLMVPVFKAALPLLASALAKEGGKALSGALQARLRRLQQQRGRKREADAENDAEAGDGALAEAGPEAFAQMLSTIETVIGRDDRRQVRSTQILPWKRICHLRIRAANGQFFLGTGFFIGPRTVATAGHCVFLRDNGGWASQIQVTPGRNGAAQPFGAASATKFRSVRGWVSGRKRACDYGVILLPPDFRAPGMGGFGFAAYTDQQLRGRKLNLAGYPGDKPSGTMWYHGRAAKSLSANVITYDTDTAGGQSGSPVWQLRAGVRTVVGIHTNGSPGGNSATRITRPVFNNLMTWRQEGTLARQSATLTGASRFVTPSRSSGRRGEAEGSPNSMSGSGMNSDMEQPF